MDLRSRIFLTLIAAAVAAGLSGCGGAPRAPDRGPGGMGVEGMGAEGMGGRGAAMLNPRVNINEIYAEASTLKANGDCPGAILKFRPVANQGPGYENAQTALGECLVRIAGSSDLSADYLEGLLWLRRAADGGWPEAQGLLAEVYITGPAQLHDPAEAAYWLALYNSNTGKGRIGFVALDPAVLKTVTAALSPADQAAGEKRAEGWQRKLWIPPTPPAATTRPGPRPAPARSSGMRRRREPVG